MLQEFIDFSKELSNRTIDNEFNHYRRAALITIPLAFILLFLYAGIGCISDLAYAKWFLNILPLPGFLGHLLSSTTYIGSALDQRNIPTRQLAFWSTSIGIGLGFLTGITLSFMLPGAVCFSTFLISTIFTMRCISSYAGLLNRTCTAFLVPCVYLTKELWFWITKGINYLFGTSLQPERPKLQLERHWSEIALLFIALAAGITCGALLFCTHTAKMIALLGVFTFFTPGLTALFAISAPLCGFIFISMFTSALMSGTDYFSKGVTCLKEMILRRTFEPVIQKFHEYRGSLLGGLLSSAVFAILLIAHFHVLCGAIGLLTTVMISATSFSIVGGIFSRLGLTFDNLFKPEDSLTKKACIVIATATGYTGLLLAFNYVRCRFFLQDNNTKKEFGHALEPTVVNLTSTSITKALRSRPSSPQKNYSDSSTESLTPESPPTSAASSQSSPPTSPRPVNNAAGPLENFGLFSLTQPSPKSSRETVGSYPKLELSCAIL